jgi:hypothetical protein
MHVLEESKRIKKQQDVMMLVMIFGVTDLELA